MKVDTHDTAALVGRARGAALRLRVLPAAERRRGLEELADLLDANSDALLQANARDIDAAKAAGLRASLVDRTTLTPARLQGMTEGVRTVAALPDPVGQILNDQTRPNGMRLAQMRVPIGVILMVYEARPNVTVDAAALCLKSGNAAILRGGREARHSNAFIGHLFGRVDLPAGWAQVVSDSDHAVVTELLHSDGIDLVIPRGGEGLIRSVVQHARMPVLKHFKGITHAFVDRDADLAMAARIIVNAKVNRPSTCNSLESVLVDAPVVDAFLPIVARALREAGVEIRADERAVRAISAGAPSLNGVVAATDEDWATEHLDLIINVKVVEDLDDALAHIQRYGTGLADVIVTQDAQRAQRFVASVDSAAVLVNASTRLVDGGEFGLGAEIGISTDRIGPRGPMGPAELTSLKWVVRGEGQLRA
jgi:glutamate-5-semialdehyde dehydrogenase